MTTRAHNYSGISEWLQELLLPETDHSDQPTIESVTQAMRSWNAAEVADATGSIIYEVVTRDGRPDATLARRFTDNRTIRMGVGLRRGSKLDNIRNREQLGLAWAALRETLDITIDTLR